MSRILLLSIFALVLSPVAATAEAPEVHRFETGGGAGEWVFVFVPFREPVGQVHYRVSSEFGAVGEEGTPLHALTQVPFVVSSDRGVVQLMDSVHGVADLTTLALGGTLRRDHPSDTWLLTRAGFRPDFLGFGFVAAADAPWETAFEVELLNDAAFDAARAEVRRGSGFFALDFAPEILPALVGEHRIRVDVPDAGWNLLQIDSDPVQPVGKRVVRGHLADGAPFDFEGYSGGFEIPLVQASQLGRWWVGQVGALRDSAGTFEAHVSWSEPALAPSVSFAHLPIALPEGASTGAYWQPDWAFDP